MGSSIVNLKEREEKVVVDAVLQKATNGLWKKILDILGKVYILHYLDVSCSEEEFSKIKKGSVLKVHIRETVDKIELSNFSDVSKEAAEDDQYTWECTVCNMGGRVSSGILTEVDSRGEGAKKLINKVLRAHKTVSPECNFTDSIQIYDENFVLLGSIGHFLKETPAG